MTRIEKLQKEIELTRELIELRKQLAQPMIIMPPVIVTPFVPPVPVQPWPGYPNPYIGDWPSPYIVTNGTISEYNGNISLTGGSA